MPLPTGAWKINVNGSEGELVINAAPDGQGQFAGTVLGSTVNGFWDETSQTITFWLSQPPIPILPVAAIFKGYLFITPPTPEVGRDVLTTLAGFVQANNVLGFPAAVGQSRRNVFGWFAQITVVV